MGDDFSFFLGLSIGFVFSVIVFWIYTGQSVQLDGTDKSFKKIHGNTIYQIDIKVLEKIEGEK